MKATFKQVKFVAIDEKKIPPARVSGAAPGQGESMYHSGLELLDAGPINVWYEVDTEGYGALACRSSLTVAARRRGIPVTTLIRQDRLFVAKCHPQDRRPLRERRSVSHEEHATD